MPGADDIVLESPPDGSAGNPPGAPASRGDWPFRKKLATYEVIFTASNRTLKGWLADGRAAVPPDLPPFDEPEKMAGWYARNKKNRVPDHLIALAAKPAGTQSVIGSTPALGLNVGGAGANGETGATSSASATATAAPLLATAAATTGHVASSAQTPAAAIAKNSSPSSGSAHVGGDGSPDISRGFSATLDRLRAAEAAAGAKYTRLLLEDGKDSEAEQARRAWQTLTKDLRAYEKDAEEVLQNSGQSWVAAEVVAAMHDVHIPLRDSVLGIFDRIEAKLEAAPRTERRRIFRDEVSRIFRALVGNKFTAAALPAD